jgi:hypothetical protein
MNTDLEGSAGLVVSLRIFASDWVFWTSTDPLAVLVTTRASATAFQSNRTLLHVSICIYPDSSSETNGRSIHSMQRMPSVHQHIWIFFHERDRIFAVSRRFRRVEVFLQIGGSNQSRFWPDLP